MHRLPVLCVYADGIHAFFPPSLAELRTEVWDASSCEDAAADTAAGEVLERWAAAPSPEHGDLGLEPGLWERYSGNAAAAIAALQPLAGSCEEITTPEDRIAAVRAAALAWQEGGAPPTGMDALLPLLLWALARTHTPPAAHLRLASHVAFVMRFVDAEAYSAGGEEMFNASLLEMALRAALATAGWAPGQWRYHRSSPGWIHVPVVDGDASGSRLAPG